MGLLISGATGQLGSEMARLAATNDRLVVRTRRSSSAFTRIQYLVGSSTVARDQVLAGDVGEPLWALGDEVEHLAETTTCIVNAAANTNWAAPWVDLYRANVVAAGEVLRLAERIATCSGREIGVIHLGSALAVRSPDYFVPERLLPLSPNATDYERSKWLGERRFLERPAIPGVRRVLVRVTGIIGSADQSPLARHHGPYLYLRAADRAGRNWLPGRPLGRVDMLTRDVAARVLRLIAERAPSIADGTICHLALGEEAPTTSTVVSVINDARSRARARPIRLVPVPEVAVTRAADVVDRFVPLSDISRNLLIGLRYLSLDRMFARDALASIVGPEHLPALDLNRLARALLQETGRAFPRSTPTTDRPFALYRG